jgi:hypothetical protein
MTSASPEQRHNNASLTRAMAVIALEHSVEDWEALGLSETNAATTTEHVTETIAALLLVRVVAVNAPDGRYQDLSTSTICRTALLSEGTTWLDSDNNNTNLEAVVAEIRQYVRTILAYYRNLPFHNYQHAFHVVLSVNKLLEFMLCTKVTAASSNNNQKQKQPPTFGLRHDPVGLLALLYAAFIHDANHLGCTNRQRIIEEPQLALLYNDQSLSEHHSLAIAFQELLNGNYTHLYRACFPTEPDYHRFRYLVIDSVLSTDIACPVRSQIAKSKYQETFGTNIVVEQELGDGAARQGRRGSVTSQISMPRARQFPGRQGRRGSNVSVSSIVSDVTIDSYGLMISKQRGGKVASPMPPAGRAGAARRSSNASIQSVDSMESEFNDADSVMYKPGGPVLIRPHHSLHDKGNSGHSDSIEQSPQNSSRRPKGRGVAQEEAQGLGRNSAHSADSMDDMSDFGDDSIAMIAKTAQRAQMQRKATRRNSTQSEVSSAGHRSIAANSVELALARASGAAKTRPRRWTETANGEENGDYAKRDHYEYNDFNGDDDEEDSSLSLTPPSSDDEHDGVIISGIPFERSDGTSYNFSNGHAYDRLLAN